MPWEQKSGGFTTKDRGGFVKNPRQYEKLRAKGMSKQRAAAITNSVNKAQPYQRAEIRRNVKRGHVAAAGGAVGLVPVIAHVAGRGGKVSSALTKPKVFFPTVIGGIGSNIYAQHQYGRATQKTLANRKYHSDRRADVEKGIISGLLKGGRKLSKVGNVSRAAAVGAANAPKVARAAGPLPPTSGGGFSSTVRGRGGKKVTTNLTTKWGPKDHSVTTRAVTTGRKSNPFWRARSNTHTTTTVRAPGTDPAKFHHTSGEVGHLTGLGRGTILAGGGAAVGGTAINQVQRRRVAKSAWEIAKDGPDQADVHISGNRKRKLKRLGVATLTAGGVAGTVGGSAHYSRALELSGKAARGSYKKAGLFAGAALASAGGAHALRSVKE